MNKNIYKLFNYANNKHGLCIVFSPKLFGYQFAFVFIAKKTPAPEPGYNHDADLSA